MSTIQNREGRAGIARRVIGTWLMLSLALGTVVVPEAWAADYYVSPSGDDSRTMAEAQDPATPWKTLTHALGQAASGDVVYAAAGTYDTPGNGETFPLALVDGVAAVGAGAGSSVISAPVGQQAFLNNDTPLSSATRLTGFTLEHDGSTSSALVQFEVGAETMAPQIDHNTFAGSGSDTAIRFHDASSASGTFTPSIDTNTFSGVRFGVYLPSLDQGSTQVFSPTITNNTFTGCSYPLIYSMTGPGEGTVGGSVEGNTFRTSGSNDMYASLVPSASSTGIVFNTTITGNDMQSGASINIFGDVEGSSTGDVTFAPTIADNTMSCERSNVNLYIYYHVGGDYTLAPTITGNTMTGAVPFQYGVNLSAFALSAGSTGQGNVFSPTITDNMITAAGGDGIFADLSGWDGGRLEGTVTIAGNVISGAALGLGWAMASMDGGDGMDWSIVISNNTITAPTEDGISLTMQSMGYAGSGVFNLTVEGNTVTGAGSYGINMYPAYSWGSANDTTETVLIRGNTVTGSTGDGMWLSFSGQTSNTLDARITDNVLEGNGGDGLELVSKSLGVNGIRVECNSITGNTGNGIRQRDGDDPTVDFGGGSLSGTGGNTISGNTGFDLYNADPDEVSAQSNWWGTTDGPTIDGNISDDDETTGGAVDFSSFLSASPTVTFAATLTDAVAVDVFPTGASIGDTLQYTAVIDSSGSCGDASVSFTAPVDANTTVVQGSVTTSRGIIQSEDPPTVAVGHLGGGEAVTITWQVVVDGGTSVQTQGTVSATRTGSTLSDDPEVGGATDPTVTSLRVAQTGTVQFAMAAYSVAEAGGSVALDVTRTAGTEGPVTVNFATVDGSATSPADYTAQSGQLAWADGDASTQQIVVPIIDDGAFEGDETFTVTLTDLPGAAIVGSPATSTVTIQDDDEAEAIPTLGQGGVALLTLALLLLGVALLRRRY